MITFNTVGIALLLGVLPAILWLFFWLREDRLHPEPRKLIFLTFVLGMASVLVVIPLEKLAVDIFTMTGVLVLSWSAIEELVKYLAAYIGGLHTRADDEPIDPVIYMITTALGFAALENTLFILDPLGTGNILGGLVTGNVRFIGATLLHVVSSGAIGMAIGMSFYKSPRMKILYRVGGVILAIALHMLFNISIISGGESVILGVFFFVWLAVMLLLLFFEKIKRITNTNNKMSRQ